MDVIIFSVALILFPRYGFSYTDDKNHKNLKNLFSCSEAWAHESRMWYSGKYFCKQLQDLRSSQKCIHI